MPKPKENFFRNEAVLALPQPAKNGTIALNKVIDVSDYLNADGKLTWQGPEGHWTIMRVCLISENGIKHPAPPESLGLEVDRMDPYAVRIVFDNMIGRILREARAKGYQSFTAFETITVVFQWLNGNKSLVLFLSFCIVNISNCLCENKFQCLIFVVLSKLYMKKFQGLIEPIV